MKFIKLIFFTSVAFFIFQCTPPSEAPYACTGEFVTLSLTVLNPNATPADSVQITVINKENDNVYPCDEYLCNERQPGTYVIMHDGFRKKISTRGDSILVEGKKDNLKFSEVFVFSGGKCHVEKIAGPDTVSLSSN